MKEITKQMIHLYNIKDFDFMGYKIFSPKDLSYHHNIIARRDGGPETIRNGAILVQHTSHDYLHTIERYDKEIFYLVVSELVLHSILHVVERDFAKRTFGLYEINPQSLF